MQAAVKDSIINLIAAGKDADFYLDEAFVADVEQKLGTPSECWDRAEPLILCACVIATFLNRYEVKKH